MSGNTLSPMASAAESSRKLVLIINCLYAASFVVGFTSIGAIVLAYMKRSDAAGTIWEGHFTYAIRTFWIGLGLGVACLLLFVVGIGVIMMPLVAVWFVVRIVRAFLAWNDNVAIANPSRFF